MSRPLKFFCLFLLATLLLGFSAGETDAAVTAFVARDGLNRYYQYDYKDLLESYVLSLLEGEGDLYRHYSRRKTAAMVDDVKGYVDYNNVLEAYAVAVITGKPFDLDTYIAQEGIPPELPPTLMGVTEDEGKLLEEELWLAKKPEESILETVEANEKGPLPVMNRVVRWQAQRSGENEGEDEERNEKEDGAEDLRYIWYIYRNNQHMRTFWYGDKDYLDYVPTDPGAFQVRTYALCPEGYAHEGYSEELIIEEKMVIEKPELDFRKSPRLILDPIEKIIQHHMAHPSWDVYEVHNFHRNRIHWLDENTWEYWIGIGYNYWICFDGIIYETRGRYYGSHAGANWNGRSLGVGYQGDFTYQEMMDAQVESGAWLVAKLLIDEGLGVKDILGHRHVGNTACPGKNFRTQDIIREAAAILELVFAQKD